MVEAILDESLMYRITKKNNTVTLTNKNDDAININLNRKNHV